MIDSIRQFLKELLIALLLLFIIAVIVFVVGANFTDSAHRTQLEQRESQYRAACAAVKGNAVWNGRHWECLK